MLKRLASRYSPVVVLVVFIGAILCMSRYAEDRKAENQENTQSRSPQAAITPNDAAKGKENADKTKFRPHFIDTFTWPEGATVWALFLTLIVITWQSVETRDAAKATKDSAKAALLNTEVLINAERAWLLVTLEPFMGSEDTRAVVAKNCGRTPAKVMCFSNMNIKIVDRESDLPRYPIYDSIDPLPDALILVPEDVQVFSTFTEQTIKDACDSDETFLAIQSAKKMAFIYGTIGYQDMLATDKPAIRETGWCCQYIPVVSGKFVLHGPYRYNDHT
jgi:hypothetical protein